MPSIRFKKCPISLIDNTFLSGQAMQPASTQPLISNLLNSSIFLSAIAGSLNPRLSPGRTRLLSRQSTSIIAQYPPGRLQNVPEPYLKLHLFVNVK